MKIDIKIDMTNQNRNPFPERTESYGQKTHSVDTLDKGLPPNMLYFQTLCYILLYLCYIYEHDMFSNVFL